MDVYAFWKAVLCQDEDEIRTYFHKDAHINWHCTNERFNVDEFMIANCEYPGDWDGEVERVEEMGDVPVTVTHVFPKDRTVSFHVTSFLKIAGGKILSLDEYWAEDGEAPKWRSEKHIGRKIR